MISEPVHSMNIRQVAPSHEFTEDDYPFYLIKPIHSEAGNDNCLLFCMSLGQYIILNPKLKRYQAVKLIKRHMETALYQTIEIRLK